MCAFSYAAAAAYDGIGADHSIFTYNGVAADKTWLVDCNRVWKFGKIKRSAVKEVVSTVHVGGTTAYIIPSALSLN